MFIFLIIFEGEMLSVLGSGGHGDIHKSMKVFVVMYALSDQWKEYAV